MEEKGKKLGLMNIVSLGVGGAIGSGIFVMMGFGIAYTGRSISLAVLVGCLYMLLAYLFHPIMASMFVLPGGDYDMKAMLMPPLMTGFSAYDKLVQGLGMASYGLAFASYFVSVFTGLTDYQVWIAAALMIIFFALSIKGTKALANITTIITGVLLVSIVVFLVVGLPNVKPGYFASTAEEPFFMGGLGGFIGAISMMSFACQGTTMAPVSVMPATKKARKTIPIAILIIATVVGIVYCLMGVVASGVLPVSEVAGQNLSVVASAIFSKPLFNVFILGAACCAIMSSLSSGMTMLRYPLLAVVQDGWLPKFFGKTTKDGYPYVIMGIFLIFSIVPLFTGLSVDSLISLIMIPAMVMNAYMNFKLIKLVKDYPEQWKKATLHMPKAIFNVLCVIGTVCALCVAFYLFKDLTPNNQIFCVVLLVLMFGVAWLRLKTGAVKAEDLMKKRADIAKVAIEATNNEE